MPDSNSHGNDLAVYASVCATLAAAIRRAVSCVCRLTVGLRSLLQVFQTGACAASKTAIGGNSGPAGGRAEPLLDAAETQAFGLK